MTRLRVQLDGGLMRIVLADPGRHNALDLDQATELADVTRQWVADPSVRAVLVSSEGRFFHVGGDLSGLAAAEQPDDELAGIAEQTAMGLAAGPTGAFARTRDLLRLSATAGLDEQLENEAQAIAACAESADGREGVRAFLDRRPPSFQG